MSTSPSTEQVALLQAALEAEHAAVYAYGVLGARLTTTRRQATEAFDAHRARRDALTAALRSAGEEAPAAQPAYDVAAANANDALALAVQVEVGVGVRWRDLVGGTTDPVLRGQAVSALTDTAVRAARWRKVIGHQPPTVALPGVPASEDAPGP